MISRKLLVTVFLFAFFKSYSQVDTSQHIVAGRVNSKEQQKKPYLVLISADGFRYDYDEKFNADFLLNIKKQGVHAKSMQPSFPSLTFPNHYTLVTGLYPAHSGIPGNVFFDKKRKEVYNMGDKDVVKDGSWYKGTPLWVLAEEQKMLSASLFWVGSEAAIKGILPTYYYSFNENMGIDQRIAAVVNWLKLPEEKRPHIITFYLPEVDHAGHDFGPDADQTKRAVLFVDSALAKLSKDVKALGLPVSFVFLADHGMIKIDSAVQTPPSDSTKYRVSGSGSMAEVRLSDSSLLESTYQTLSGNSKGYKVIKSTETLSYWHYSKSEDWYGRIADILLIPDSSYVFGSRNFKPRGYHGFDPLKVKEMHAYFSAWGPAFKSNITIPTFENVNVYPMIAKILGLKITERIDGNETVLDPILVK
ncbi:alkaline phosphatase family protein [Pedobacter sp. HMF7647]|uniref:Alkaline phosphatase family protein n=1 Tax=Hufsiella arboris TaxID=2695275 RepID=A0A7K1Y6B5_9SPHI|nr:ectonucleotide pyrophosphatase/phosphodiesterase [Hufsiella arboris]MXV49578.1 alkaline phosphatase family protein [Hufsiella arboris]